MSKIIEGGFVPLNLAEGDCALPTTEGICADNKEVKSMRDFVKYEKIDTLASEKLTIARHLIESIKKYLGVGTEAEIWENKKFRNFVGNSYADGVLKEKFKPLGPAHSTALLDNFNIDNSLEQWSKQSEKLFGKKFYHVPFQMIDFIDENTELNRLDLAALRDKKFSCFGVVLNTDVSTGRGKHWFCIYGDLAHEGTKEDPIVIEYFNSSGNPPMNSVNVWMEDTCHRLLRDSGLYCITTHSASQRLQHSQTECGVWSLLYIRSRLENHPANWFYTVRADDKDMIDMRNRLFREN